MIKKKFRLKDMPVWEHLEFTLKKTTYADRLLWLDQAMDFVLKVRKNRRSIKIYKI